jgi:formylglycine-generating enzyme required for sulfatase activity
MNVKSKIKSQKSKIKNGGQAFAIAILAAAPVFAHAQAPLRAAKVDGKYGVLVKGKLIPEVVKRGQLEIGRFEVTRAQYLAWDNVYPFKPGTENFPANEITFAEAQGYAEWLSGLTGETWRVPNEDEVALLYQNSSGENVRGTGSGGLQEVGSFKPNGKPGEEPIYDLGGNVAEWAIGKDGKGKTIGGSAERAPGSKQAPTPGFTGFRVMRGSRKN